MAQVVTGQGQQFCNQLQKAPTMGSRMNLCIVATPLPLPLQPHPRNLRLRQAGLIALLPAIILSLETRLAEYENSCLLSRTVTRGHFYCGENGDTSIVV